MVGDQFDTDETDGWDNSINLRRAIAQKFKPTSRCLKRVSIKLTKTLNTDGYIEIRKSLTSGDKLPDGYPQSSEGRRGYAVIPNAKMDGVAQLIDLDIVLESGDLTNGVWLVFCSNNYDSSCPEATPYCNDIHFTVRRGRFF